MATSTNYRIQGDTRREARRDDDSDDVLISHSALLILLDSRGLDVRKFDNEYIK